MNEPISIRTILTSGDSYDGWLYLPAKPWTLDTDGIFVNSDKDTDLTSTDHLPSVVKEGDWQVTIDSETVEDIIINAKDQRDQASEDELFEALVYYIENDAFIVFD